MDVNQVKGEFTKLQKNIQSVIKLLDKIITLDQNQGENLQRIKQEIAKLRDLAHGLQQDVVVNSKLMDWLGQYERNLKHKEEEIKKQFGIKLEKELQGLGLPLSGQYSELKAGLFTIEVDFNKWQAILWYGPKQERLGQYPLSANRIAKQIEKARRELGSQLPEEQLLEKIKEAYHRVVGTRRREPASIISVLAELAHLLQDKRFYSDPRRDNYKSYSRADFSHDLFCVRRKIRLTVATRAQTRHRSDFLWVPENDKGSGSVYSHLQIEEVEQ